MAKINSQRKGRSAERDVSKILNERFGDGKKVFSPTPSSGAWGGGQNRERRIDMSLEQKMTLVSDIMTPPDFRFILESKFYADISFWDLFNESSKLRDWIEQVVSDSSFVGKEPFLVMKFNRKPKIAMTKIDAPGKVFTFYYKNESWHCYLFEDLLSFEREWWFLS